MFYETKQGLGWRNCTSHLPRSQPSGSQSERGVGGGAKIWLHSAESAIPQTWAVRSGTKSPWGWKGGARTWGVGAGLNSRRRPWGEAGGAQREGSRGAGQRCCRRGLKAEGEGRAGVGGARARGAVNNKGRGPRPSQKGPNLWGNGAVSFAAAEGP